MRPTGQPDAILASSAAFNAGSDELARIASDLDGVVGGGMPSWSGDAATKFSSTWRAQSGRIVAGAQTMAEVAGVLSVLARGLEQAQADYDAATGPSAGVGRGLPGVVIAPMLLEEQLKRRAAADFDRIAGVATEFDEAPWVVAGTAASRAQDLTDTGAQLNSTFIRKVSGYVTADGKQVSEYVRYRAGWADELNKVVPARDVSWLRNAETVGKVVKVGAFVLAGTEQLAQDSSSGHHYDAGQEAVRVGVAVAVTGGEILAAGEVGAMIGTFIPIPVVGTLVGFGVGLAVGWGLEHFHVGDTIKKAIFGTGLSINGWKPFG